MSEQIPTPDVQPTNPEGSEPTHNVLLGVGAIALGAGVSLAVAKGVLPPELAGRHEATTGTVHEAPIAVAGMFSFIASRRARSVLARAERTQRKLDFDSSVATSLARAGDIRRVGIAPHPNDLPRTERERRRQLKLARQHDKQINRKAEQWSYDRFNIDTQRDLDPATGGYRGGDLLDRQMGDLGTPAYVDRVYDGTRTPSQEKSMMRQQHRYVDLNEKNARHDAEMAAMQNGTNKKGSRLERRLQRQLKRGHKWADRI